MNYHENFHPLKTVAYFQPSLLKDCLIYSTANEQVEELKQIIIITNQWSLGLRGYNWMLLAHRP